MIFRPSSVTGSEAHPASCPMGTGGSLPRGKEQSRRDADHSPHLVPRSRMSRSYTSPRETPSWRIVGLLCLYIQEHFLASGVHGVKLNRCLALLMI
jgi:hypothetical protein